MNRTLLAALVLGATLGAGVGCDNSARRQQQEANETVSDASRKINDAETDARAARIEADKKIAEARKEASDELSDAQRKLTSERADFREDTHKRVAAVDKQIDDLKVQSARSAGKIKEDIDRTITDASARRSAIEGEMRSFEASTDRDVKELNKSLDHELDELESVLRRGVLRRD
jgi:chromosome segregation ATPase